MQKQIIITDTNGLNKFNEALIQYREIIEKVLAEYSGMNIEPINSTSEFQKLLEAPELFTRETIVKSMGAPSIGGIKLSHQKLLELIELPDNFNRLIQSIEHYKIIHSRVLAKANLEWFTIEGNQLHEAVDVIGRMRDGFTTYATTADQINRLETFHNLKKQLEESVKVFGIDILIGLKCKLLRIDSDYSIKPNIEMILNR